MPLNFCIVLPVYNESDGIVRCIGDIANHLKKINFSTGIIAVDDGSSDDSYALMASLAETIPNLFVVRHTKNGGYGMANRTGARIAFDQGFEYALVMDADGTQSVHYIDSFIPHMNAGIDFIKATRYSKGGGVIDVHWKRVWVSKIGNKMAQYFMRVPLTDFTNGFRAIKTKIWRELLTQERGFEVLIEEVYLARKMGGLTFAEVPYTLTARPEEGAKSKFLYSLAVYKNYAQYLFKL
jgi:dolichol-phosphate mannosyltransferase